MKTAIDRLFNDVKPQLRKEGTSAVVSLTAAGEIPQSASNCNAALANHSPTSMFSDANSCRLSRVSGEIATCKRRRNGAG